MSSSETIKAVAGNAAAAAANEQQPQQQQGEHVQMPPAQPSKLGRLSSKEIAEQKFTHLDVAAAYKVHKVRLDRALIKFGHNHPTADGEFADMDQELVLNIHLITPEELLQRYNISMEGGLSDLQVQRLKQEFGSNKPSLRHTPEIFKYLSEYGGLFPTLMWLGAMIAFIGYSTNTASLTNLYVGVVLIINVFMMSTFTYMQHRRTRDIHEGVRMLLPYSYRVRRDGIVRVIPTVDLVVGDIVEIEKGDVIPADIRLISVSRLMIDKSALTGETVPEMATVEATSENPLETHNMVFCGTSALEGAGVGVVLFTGDDTLLGRITHGDENQADDVALILSDIDEFIQITAISAVCVGVVYFVAALIISNPAIDSLVFMIGIIVALVPEAITSTVTVALRLAVHRLGMHHILVKHVAIIETLGSVTVICSDKTGTLTQNKMTVSKIWMDGFNYSQHNSETMSARLHAPPADQQTATSLAEQQLQRAQNNLASASATFPAFHRAGMLCNRAVFENEPGEERIIAGPRKAIGSASEVAILNFSEQFTRVAPFRAAHTKVAEIVFDSTNKWQLSIHRMAPYETDKKHNYVLIMMGAAEKVLERCSFVMIDGKEIALTSDLISKAVTQAIVYAKGGHRVLAVAQTLLPADAFPEDYEFDLGLINFPCNNLTFLGLFALWDPPRPEVADAVYQCREAKIKVIMITGDHPSTAKAIARETGIIEPGNETVEDMIERLNVHVSEINKDEIKAIVIEGSVLDTMKEKDWDFVLSRDNIVFARISPLQKLRIVEENQKRGEIVAVTGDGVNDVAAIQQADFGIAMGIMGSELAKDVADLVLLDDNFASIIKGIEEGRLLFDNLRKSLAYVLSSNFPEAIPFLAYLAVGLPLPLSTVLILLIDSGTDLWPAISLAYEPAEEALLKRAPKKNERLVTLNMIAFAYFQIGVIQCLAGFFAYLVVMGDYGYPPWTLFFMGDSWNNENVIIGGKGTTFRNQVLAQAQSAYFAAIIIVQWTDLLISKTRTDSLFRQGMRNQWLNMGLLFETFIGCMVIYVPALNPLFGTGPLSFVHLLPSLPFAFFIFLYDEVRKWLIRHFPTGFTARTTAW